MNEKPPRSYHCISCNKCILRRDHHCIWIMNCIGYRNFKTFFFFLFNVWTTCLFVCFNYRHIVYVIFGNPMVSISLIYFGCLEFAFTLAIGVVTCYYFCFELWLILKAYTWSEYLSTYKGDPNKPRSQYSISCFKNLQNIFGQNVLEWVLPCSKLVT